MERHVGAWMHIEHILGLYVFAACNRSGPTNMHNTAMVVNSEHKIRFAQDLALYNLTLTEEIEGFDGAAHIEAWNSDAEWQGARAVCEALTAVEDDWGESIFATNVVFEPLIGELFRSNLVMQSAAGHGDYVTPTVIGAGEYDYAQRDLRWTIACFAPLTEDREFADHNKQLMQGWLTKWVPHVPRCGAQDAAALEPTRCQAAALRGLAGQGQEPVRRDLYRSRSRHPRGAEAVTSARAATFTTAESPFKSDNTASNQCGYTLMNNQVGMLIANVVGRQENVTVRHLPSMIRIDADRPLRPVYAEVDEEAGEEEGWFNAAEFEENMSTHYGRMVHLDDRTIMFANPEDAAEYLDFDLKPIQ